MRIGKIKNRGARGPSKNGLKIGQRTIRELSNEEINTVLLRIKKNALRSGNKKHYKNLKRTISLIRKSDKDGILIPVSDSKFDVNYKNCIWSDTIYPDRQRKWLKMEKRREGERIKLKKFSFIDNPIGTYELLQKIVKAEAQTKSSYIDFLDHRCLDIAPYLVLGLMRHNIAKNIFIGGRISGPIYDVMDAVNLLDFYRFRLNKNVEDGKIFPFKIRSRRKPENTSEDGDNSPGFNTTEEKTSGQFVRTFGRWLKELEPPLELTDEAQRDIGTLFGELLDNAKRHSNPDDIDGQWHVAGFMEDLNFSDPTDEKKYVCHFSIISPGRSIYESMQEAPDDVKERITKHIDSYWSSGKKQNKVEAYWNLSAMQDGISRMPKTGASKNGIGFMESLVALINAFGKTDDENLKPAMTIISGQSCIRVKYPYNRHTTNEKNVRTLAFNDDNDLKKPQHDDYVSNMPGQFPGTLITVRFVMDSQHITEMVNSV